MAFTRFHNLFAGLLTGSLANTYVSPPGTTTLILSAVVCNTTGAAVLLTLATVAASGGTARTIIDGRNLADTQSDLVPEVIGETLEPGGAIQGLGLDLTMILRGLQITQ